MNYRWAGLLCCAAFAAALAALLLGAAPLDGGDQETMEPVVFSVPSGFYDEPFYLELDGGGEHIYYTLDSSDPDENAILYTGPILIQDASPNENVYSQITDVSLDYHPDILSGNEQESTYDYVTPQEPVDKATVVRAVSVDRFGNRSEIVEAVYFVGFGDKKGYDGLFIMSVTTDPSNLFDHETGIYVLGKAFDDYLADGVHVPDVSLRYNFWDANYWRKGREWERKAHICCFTGDRKIAFSGNYGIRIQGRETRALLPKNLNIYARREYGSPEIDTEALFGASYRLRGLNLNCGPNDLMLKDYLGNKLTAEMDMVTREYVPCALFLDGEYWGLFWLTPRLKKDYLSQKYGVDPDNVVGIKQDEVETGREEDLALYSEMMEYIANSDMRIPENYAHACELIDMKSCIDYYATEIYIVNLDWPYNNRAEWRVRKANGSGYSDGKWRWILYDLDWSMYKKMAELNAISTAMNTDAMLASLMENEDFVNALYDRLIELAEDTFAPEKIEAFVEDYKGMMEDAIEKAYHRFYGDQKSVDDFFRRCNAVTAFFKNRHDYVINTYGETAR